MKNGSVTGKLLKISLGRNQNGATIARLVTDNASIGVAGTIIVPSNVVYAAGVDYGIAEAQHMLDAVRIAKDNDQDASEVYNRLQQAVVGAMNRELCGYNVTISGGIPEKGDEISITESSFNHYQETGKTENGETAVVYHDKVKDKYLLVVQKDWTTPRINSIGFTPSEELLIARETAKARVANEVRDEKFSVANIFGARKKVTVEDAPADDASDSGDDAADEGIKLKGAAPTKRGKKAAAANANV